MHHHHHSHHHHGHGGQSLAQNNEHYFDSMGPHAFSQPWAQDLSNQIVNEIHEEYQWIFGSQATPSREPQGKMLDFACGNGLLSRALGRQFATIRGIDISSVMVEQYNIKAREEGFSEAKMHATKADLLDEPDELKTPEYTDFDLIAVGMALHHMEDPEATIRALSARLAPGGSLLIIDWVDRSENGGKVSASKDDAAWRHAVSRSGFNEGEMRTWFGGAALGSFGWKTFRSMSKLPEEIGGEGLLVLTRGIKVNEPGAADQKL